MKKTSFKKELREYEQRIFQEAFRIINKKLSEKDASVSELKSMHVKIVEELKKNQKGLEKQIKENEEKITELREEIYKNENQYQEKIYKINENFKNEKEDLEKRNEDLSKNCIELKKFIEEKRNDMTKLEREAVNEVKAALANEKTKRLKSKDGFLKELEESKLKLKEKDNINTRLKEEMKRLENNVESLKKSSDKKSDQKSIYTKEISSLKKQIKSLEAQIRVKNKEISLLKSDFDNKLKEKLEQAESEKPVESFIKGKVPVSTGSEEIEKSITRNIDMLKEIFYADENDDIDEIKETDEQTKAARKLRGR